MPFMKYFFLVYYKMLQENIKQKPDNMIDEYVVIPEIEYLNGSDSPVEG